MASYKQTEYELLRRRCAALHQQGWKQASIAQALGLTQGWVSRTLTKYRQQGQDALTWRKPAGATAKLTTTQVDQLVEELNKGAEHHGFPGQIWTRPRINEVIKKRFGWGGPPPRVSYDPSQIGRLLKKVGWSRQLPQRKVRQQDPQAVEHWLQQRLVELKKSQG